MAITFPLSASTFADRLKVASVKWHLQQQQEVSGLGSGQILAANLAPSLWTADVTLAPAYHGEMAQIQALIETLDGAINAFYLYAPQMPGPQYDPDGIILGVSTPSIHTLDANNKAMRVMGLPAGYVLTAGDFIAFNYSSGTKRAFHRIVETATADGSGLTPLFEVRPHIRSGATTSTAVTLIKPAALMAMVPGTFDAGAAGPLVSNGMSFTAIQRLT